jgi:hypothetical protein
MKTKCNLFLLLTYFKTKLGYAQTFLPFLCLVIGASLSIFFFLLEHVMNKKSNKYKTTF